MYDVFYTQDRSVYLTTKHGNNNNNNKNKIINL